MIKYMFLLLFCLINNTVAIDGLRNRMGSDSLTRRDCPKGEVPWLQLLTAESLYESGKMSKAPKIFQNMSEDLCEKYIKFLKPESIRFLHSNVIQAYICDRRLLMKNCNDNPTVSCKQKMAYIIDSFNIIVYLNP
ncbi:MAG TPA: hypothetical protein VJ201_02725 [Candidatus Babeliales bacterium]|nr:hypothetical protein [Candidatus Babeliales bacterium]HLC06631.1 hypothetical protein [Candidatus Babeliales bacterium]